MRVLLFGASGFIGAHVHRLLSADPRVSEVDAPGRARHDLLAGDPADLAELVRRARPDAVINCTGALVGSAYQLVRANTGVTAALIDAVAAAAPAARLVRLGSAGEYGPVPHGRAAAEDDPAAPVSEYGLSHLAGTRLIELAGAAGRVDGLSVRVFNPIGPGLAEENLLGRAARLLRAALAAGEPAITLGDLSAYRDFVDVRDVAAAVVAGALAPDLPHRVVNAASGRAVTSREVVRMLAGEAGFTGEVRESGGGPARSAAVSWMRGDPARAAAMLGWQPDYDLAASVKAVWADAPPAR